MAEILHGGGTPTYSVQTNTTFAPTGGQVRYLSSFLVADDDNSFSVNENPLTEINFALKLGRGRSLGQVSETETAFALTVVGGGPLEVSLGQVVETNEARPLVPAITLGRASETDMVFGLAAPEPTDQEVPISLASETDATQALTLVAGAFVATLGLAVETDEVRHLEGLGEAIELTAIAEELDTAQPLFVIIPPEIVLTLLTPVLNQAPGSLEVIISGGLPESVVDIEIDGIVVLTVTLDTDGNIGPISVPVDTTLGTQGTHDLTAGTAATTFEVLLAPSVFPDPPDPDEPPTDVDEAVINGVRHWVFQDLVSGGIGTWVLPYNPKPTETTSPFPVKAFNSRHTTGNAGKWHIFQGQTPPREWQFGGYLPRQEHVERLLEFRDLNRRFYIIDHRNRAWVCILTHVEIVPRLRHTWVGRGDDPLLTDWGHDYKVTAMILDPDWVTPT